MKVISAVLPVATLALAVTFGNACAAQPSRSVEKFTKEFCAAQKDAKALKEKVFIVSSELFSEKESTFSCAAIGDFKISRTDTKDDPGHFIFTIDSVKPNVNTYDCDGKADAGMKVVGLNCYPVNKETSEHKK